jgi:glucuronate isomerase
MVTELEAALAEVPILDVHTHLVGGKLAARGLHDILLYHMVVSDLYAAGCSTGARLSEFPLWPDQCEAHARISEALPYLRFIQNTSSFWCVRIILRELYDWTEPIDESNWQRLDGMVRERASERSWPLLLLDRAGVKRSGTELARRGDGTDDDRLQFALEWGFFTRTQWGEFDTALYELERCWGRDPESPAPIGTGARPTTERQIRTLEDVRAAIGHYVSSIPYAQILATATHFSTAIDYRLPSDEEMARALSRRAAAGPEERDCYASYVNEAFLQALEARPDRVVIQFSLGAEPLPFETGCRLSQRTIGQMAEMIGRHPDLQFQCFLASRHANQSMCTLARELPNLSLAGYWWHNFFPDAIGQVMLERLEMLPASKQVGFFSDAYCTEWTYAKAVLVRKILARVLAGRIELGQLDLASALEFARAIFYESPQRLLRMVPRFE